MRVPTMKVRHKDLGEVTINESDFNPDVHQPVDERSKQVAAQQKTVRDSKERPPQGTPTALPASPEGGPDPSIKNTPEGAPPQPVVGASKPQSAGAPPAGAPPAGAPPAGAPPAGAPKGK